MIRSFMFRHPFTYKVIVLLLILSVIFSCSFIVNKLIDSSFTYNLRMGVYYKVKALFLDGRNADWVSPQEHFSAIVKGYGKGGIVVLKKPNNEFIDAKLADVVIINENKVSYLIKEYINKIIYVDYYQYKMDKKTYNSVILWNESGEPLNLEIIIRGLGTPVKNPPTNIVHNIFANYYLKKLGIGI